MPLRNRVAPSGEIVADPGRGLLMGNRGCLHGLGRDLGVSRWRSGAKRWVFWPAADEASWQFQCTGASARSLKR